MTTLANNRLKVDDHEPITLREFFDQNPELSPRERNVISALRPGQVTHIGGGAAARFRIEAVAAGPPPRTFLPIKRRCYAGCGDPFFVSVEALAHQWVEDATYAAGRGEPIPSINDAADAFELCLDCAAGEYYPEEKAGLVPPVYACPVCSRRLERARIEGKPVDEVGCLSDEGCGALFLVQNSPTGVSPILVRFYATKEAR